MPKITWDLDPVLFYYPDWLDILPGGGIRYYSLLFVFVFLGGFKLLDWQIQRAGGYEEDASDFVMYGVLGVLIGCRIGHVFFYEFDHFLRDPLWLFAIHKGGLSSHGGTLGLLVVMWLFTRRKRQSFLEGCDRFSFSAALGATLVRAGNWFNSEIVGRTTDQTWGVYFPRYDRNAVEPIYRHPSQLYEVALGLTVMAALYFADKKLGEEKRPRGALISVFFAVYFTGRFFVEYFKEYQTLGADFPLTMGQILSIIPASIGYYGIYWSVKRGEPAHWYTEEDDDEDYDDEDYDEDEDLPDDGKRDADVEAEFEK